MTSTPASFRGAFAPLLIVAAFAVNAIAHALLISPALGEEITINLPGDVPLTLVRIPAGSFQMGRYPGERSSGSEEDPQHTVTIAYNYYMGKYELTQRQWLAVMGNWPETAPDSLYGLGDDRPAYWISWDDCQNFVTALNTHIANTSQGPATFRLPSEAEWEYACRAGTQTRFFFGDSLSVNDLSTDGPAGTLPGNRSDYMWFGQIQTMMVVGTKLPNQFGLYDTSGNVWEWCQDRYHSSYTGAPEDGSAWETPSGITRVRRGGSSRFPAFGCRSSARVEDIPGDRSPVIGLRLSRSIPPPTTAFHGDPVRGAAPLTVNLSDDSTEGPTSWAWDFQNDGTVDSTEQNPQFTYSAPGTYSVKLTASNAGGTDSLIRADYITVLPSILRVDKWDLALKPAGDEMQCSGEFNSEYGSVSPEADGVAYRFGAAPNRVAENFLAGSLAPGRGGKYTYSDPAKTKSGAFLLYQGGSSRSRFAISSKGEYHALQGRTALPIEMESGSFSDAVEIRTALKGIPAGADGSTFRAGNPYVSPEFFVDSLLIERSSTGAGKDSLRLAARMPGAPLLNPSTDTFTLDLGWLQIVVPPNAWTLKDKAADLVCVYSGALDAVSKYTLRVNTGKQTISLQCTEMNATGAAAKAVVGVSYGAFSRTNHLKLQTKTSSSGVQYTY